MRILIVAAAAVGLLTGCGEAGGQSMTGTFELRLPGGVATLSLSSDASGEVTGWMEAVNGTVYQATGRDRVDEEGDRSVKGVLTGALSADFELYHEDGDEYGFVLTPHAPAGGLQVGETVIFRAVRMGDAARVREGADESEHEPPDSTPVPGLDARLVGVWATQVVMNSQVGSVATEMRMSLGADGILRDLGSRALGGIGGGEFDVFGGATGEEAQWRIEGDMLVVRYHGSPWVRLARFAFSNGRLVLRYVQDGSIQIWSRTR